MSIVTGFISLIMYILGISYTVFKTDSNSNIKKISRISHCYIGYLALIISIYHTILAGDKLSLASGYVTFLLILICNISGILLKYLRPSKRKRIAHITIGLSTAVAVVLHILIKFF
jgi:glucose uptake protein GlcU